MCIILVEPTNRGRILMQYLCIKTGSSGTIAVTPLSLLLIISSMLVMDYVIVKLIKLSLIKVNLNKIMIINISVEL